MLPTSHPAPRVLTWGVSLALPGTSPSWRSWWSTGGPSSRSAPSEQQERAVRAGGQRGGRCGVGAGTHLVSLLILRRLLDPHQLLLLLHVVPSGLHGLQCLPPVVLQHRRSTSSLSPSTRGLSPPPTPPPAPQHPPQHPSIPISSQHLPPDPLSSAARSPRPFWGTRAASRAPPYRSRASSPTAPSWPPPAPCIWPGKGRMNDERGHRPPHRATGGAGMPFPTVLQPHTQQSQGSLPPPSLRAEAGDDPKGCDGCSCDAPGDSRPTAAVPEDERSPPHRAGLGGGRWGVMGCGRGE